MIILCVLIVSVIMFFVIGVISMKIASDKYSETLAVIAGIFLGLCIIFLTTFAVLGILYVFSYYEVTYFNKEHNTKYTTDDFFFTKEN